MLRLIVLLLACLPLTSSGEENRPANPAFANELFQAACELAEDVGLSCKGIPAPLLMATDTRPNLLGYYYRGTNIVFITNRCLLDIADETKCSAVAVHEMVHYIDYLNGERDGCSSEAKAWDVHNAYVIKMGRLDLVRTDWVRSYPQCQQTGAIRNPV